MGRKVGVFLKRGLLNEQDKKLARSYSRFRKKWF